MRNDYEVKDGIVEINLGNGLKTIVDLDSLEKLKSLDVKWYPHFDYNRFYAYASLKDTTIKMHRLLTNAPPGKVVDHINGDSLDNRVENLRVCSQIENGHNRSRLNKNNSSGVRGVSFHKASGKWRAFIRVDRKQIHLGLFDNKSDAEKAVESYRNNLFKEERQ
jgi:HNH endonuclease/AP2 domain